MYDLAIVGGSCYIDGEFKLTNIYCKDEKIAFIGNQVADAEKIINAQGLKVIPGIIDPHVHLHLRLTKGFSVDDFLSGSQLAAMGGVTTLLDFLDPIYDNAEFLKTLTVRKAEAKESIVDYSFHCTLGNYHDDVSELVKMIKAEGLTSIKVFTTYSSSNRRCSYEKIAEILQEDILMMAHCEKDEWIKPCKTMDEYEASRSEACELEAVKELIGLAVGEGKLYVVHVSSGNTLKKVPLTSKVFYESCPQYFYLSKDLFLEEDGKKYLLAPPLRSKESIELMHRHVDKLSTIGTDHCAFMLRDKLLDQPVDQILKGIGSLGYAFQLMYSLFGHGVIDKFTKNPAEIFGLTNKGEITLGKDADFAIFDENQLTTCKKAYSKSDICAYEGYELPLKMVLTILRGNVIMQNGRVINHKGKFVRRFQ